MARIGIKKFLLRVRGSSLIEVIIAMLIIGMVYGASIIVYLNVIEKSFSSRRTLANIYIQGLVTKMKSDKSIKDEKFDFDGMTIYQEVKELSGNTKAKMIRWEARDVTGKVVAERKLIQYVSNR